jgi:spermidine synthase
VGSRLRFSTLDQKRWAEALAQPALSRLDCPKRAVVFSLGEGLAERELLREPCLQSITSVVRDRIAVDAAERQPWWRQLVANAWHSPRVHCIERDPAVWLSELPPTLFDLIIVDLPDPDNYTDAKYYTRFFYRQIRKHLSPSALLVTQATSALRSPKTFASIRATLDEADYATATYRAAMTTLGEWYFLLASPTRIPENLRAVAAAAPFNAPQSFVFPPDAIATQKGRVSKLDDPAALDAFLEETGDNDP